MMCNILVYLHVTFLGFKKKFRRFACNSFITFKTKFECNVINYYHAKLFEIYMQHLYSMYETIFLLSKFYASFLQICMYIFVEFIKHLKNVSEIFLKLFLEKTKFVCIVFNIYHITITENCMQHFYKFNITLSSRI